MILPTDWIAESYRNDDPAKDTSTSTSKYSTNNLSKDRSKIPRIFFCPNICKNSDKLPFMTSWVKVTISKISRVKVIKF